MDLQEAKILLSLLLIFAAYMWWGWKSITELSKQLVNVSESLG